MTKKQDKAEEIIELDGGWYTATMAARVLSKTSGKVINPAYIRSLARMGKIQFKAVGTRMNLYRKEDIDRYRVEERGMKASKAMHARAKKQKVIATTKEKQSQPL